MDILFERNYIFETKYSTVPDESYMDEDMTYVYDNCEVIELIVKCLIEVLHHHFVFIIDYRSYLECKACMQFGKIVFVPSVSSTG